VRISFAEVGALIGLLALASPASAQEEWEFFEEVSDYFSQQTIEGVSKHAEAPTETPATVTIIDREEIDRYGFRTLSDVLAFASLGNFVQYDRRYDLLGTRGQFFFEDFNTRILVMMNGHSVNEPWANFGGIGREMLVPMDLVERIEIVYGPSSLLYGGYSLFGIVNVVTRSGATMPGGNVRLSAGSWETFEGVGTWGVSGLTDPEEGEATRWSFLASAGYYDTRGENLNLPEWDVTDTGAYEGTDLEGSQIWGGPQSGTDFESSPYAFLHASYGGFQAMARIGHRRRGEPFAPYFAMYGRDDQHIRDGRAFLDLRWDKKINTSFDLSVRVFHDTYSYDEQDPYADSFTYMDVAPEERGYYFTLNVDDRDTGAEVRGSYKKGTFFLTLGGEYRYRKLDQRQGNRFFDGSPAPEGDGLPTSIEEQQNGEFAVVYAQGEWRPHQKLSFVLGGNYANTTPGGSKAQPRVAAIFKPQSSLSIKALYGRGFRPPSLFEGRYQDFLNQVDNPVLESEEIASAELSIMWNATRRLSLQGYAFDSQLSGLIQGVTITDAADVQGGVGTRPGDPLTPEEIAESSILQYQSTGDVDSWGTGASLRYRTPTLQAYANLAYADSELLTTDGETSELPSVSQWLANMGASYVSGDWTTSLWGRYVGPQKIDPSFVGHPYGTHDAGDFFETNLRVRYSTFLKLPMTFQLDVRNLFDTGGEFAASTVYSIPRLPIEGRRALLGIEVAF